jgi:hypothetical protein
MPTAATIFCLLSLAALGSCTDRRGPDRVVVPGSGPQLAGIGRLPAGGAAGRPLALPASARVAAAPASASRPLVGTYVIDVAETSRRAGLFGSLVAAKVRGSSLELRADHGYVGWRDGVAESAGRWRVVRGRLLLEQTHELDLPAAQRGEGRVRDGVLTVTTVRSGVEVALVFRRQPPPK